MQTTDQKPAYAVVGDYSVEPMQWQHLSEGQRERMAPVRAAFIMALRVAEERKAKGEQENAKPVYFIPRLWDVKKYLKGGGYSDEQVQTLIGEAIEVLFTRSPRQMFGLWAYTPQTRSEELTEKQKAVKAEFESILGSF